MGSCCNPTNVQNAPNVVPLGDDTDDELGEMTMQAHGSVPPGSTTIPASGGNAIVVSLSCIWHCSSADAPRFRDALGLRTQQQTVVIVAKQGPVAKHIAHHLRAMGFIMRSFAE